MKGRAKLLAKMKAMPKAARSRIKQGLAESADELVAMQKRLVPVRTGKLRDSIKQTWGDKPDLGTSAALAGGGPVAGDPDLTVWITAGGGTRNDGWYARFVEFGTAPHPQGGQFEGTEHPGTTAQPFFYVSYRALKRRIRGRIIRAIRDAVKQVAKR